jgi:acyl carrier protein
VTTPKTRDEILSKMVALTAEALDVSPEAVDVDAELATLGLDSIRAFAVTGDLAEWLERELSATLLWEYPTLRELATHLAAAEEDAGST